MHTKMEELTETKNRLIEDLEEIVKGSEVCDTEVAGQLTDMIKDIAEAEEKCWKACYYKEIVCAMDDARHDEGGHRMGYDHYRYASGRFAPSGHGHYSGYSPMTGPYMKHDIPATHDDLAHRMGYPKSQTGTSMRYGMHDEERSDYGRSYDGYRRARRGYHETKSHEDREKMSKHAKDHLAEAEMSIRDIWKDADPDLKHKMKDDMLKLVNDMVV